MSIRSGSHYQVLGVDRNAGIEDIRRAYRALARQHHPDRQGGRTTPDMVRINEAWHVLSNPERRRRYDESIDPSESSGRMAEDTRVADLRTTVARSTPARFPWKFVVGFFAFTTVVILLVGALTEPGEPTPIDNIIRVGSCIDVDEQIQEAWEVSCDGPHDAQVTALVPFDGRCPAGTETNRDRQGLGLVCSTP